MHTPGPWEVHEAPHRDGEFWCSIGYAGRGPITDIVGAEGNHTRWFQPVAGMKFLVTPVEQQKANAALVAASPTLLEACELARKRFYEQNGQVSEEVWTANYQAVKILSEAIEMARKYEDKLKINRNCLHESP